MATFAPAPSEVDRMIQIVTEQHHPDLIEGAVRIKAVFAHAPVNRDGEPTGQFAMEKDGRRILARIKKSSEEDRASGKADATITFDAEEWGLRENEPNGVARRRALIDHELCHLVVKRDKKTNRIRTNDMGRPILGMRGHDWEITGFRAVVERHGANAYEHAEAQRFIDAYGNILFDFADDLAGARPRARRRIDRQRSLPVEP